MKPTKSFVGLALASVASLGLSACSGDAPSSPAEDSAANVVQSAEVEDPQSEEEPEGPSQAELKAYFEALASGDPGTMAEAVEMAAPGSNAEAYAIYLAAASQADRDGGYSAEPQTVKTVDGGFETCTDGTGDDTCSVYTNIQHDGEKIADFDAGDYPLAGRLSLGNGEAQALGTAGEATLVAAYKSISGYVVAVFEISSATPGMWPMATYTAPDGRQSQETMRSGPTELGEGAFANYAFFFEGAEFGGQVRLEAIDGNGYDAGEATFATQ